LKKCVGLPFWAVAIIVALFVIVVFHQTIAIPLSAEDLQVHVNYIFFTGDDLLPESFYGNGFGILPGEFVHKLGRRPDQIGGVYRPLTAALMALDFAICRTDSLCYHMTNLLIQIACSIAVLLLAWQFTKGNWLVSLAAALLFTVNPTHSMTQVVMLQRSDMLCTLFYLPSILFFARYVDDRTRHAKLNYSLSMVFMVLCLMSKEMAASLPIALILYDLFVVRSDKPFTATGASELARRHWPFWALLVGYFVFRIIAFGSVGGYPALEEGSDAAPIALMFGRQNITNIITGLNHLFGVSSSLRLVRYALLSVIFLPLLFGTDRRIRFSILAIVVSMFPIITQTSITPLYMYMSSAWFSIGIVGSLYWLLGLIPRKKAAQALFGLFIAFGIYSFLAKINHDIQVTRRRIDFAYQTADVVLEKASPIPKGARLYMVTPSMMESAGRVDFDPAIETVLRLKQDDNSLKFWPIPINVERDAMMELLDAAALDMERLDIGKKTFFFDNLSGSLRLRTDILDRLKSRNAIRTLPGTLPGDHLGWMFDKSDLGWSVVDASGNAIETKLSLGALEFNTAGMETHIVSPELRVSTIRADRFSFSLLVSGPKALNEIPARVQWVSDTYPEWSDEQTRTVMIEVDGKRHLYTAETGMDFHWVTANRVTRMRLVLPPFGGSVSLREVIIHFGGPRGTKKE